MILHVSKKTKLINCITILQIIKKYYSITKLKKPKTIEVHSKWMCIIQNDLRLRNRNINKYLLPASSRQGKTKTSFFQHCEKRRIRKVIHLFIANYSQVPFTGIVNNWKQTKENICRKYPSPNQSQSIALNCHCCQQKSINH